MKNGIQDRNFSNQNKDPSLSGAVTTFLIIRLRTLFLQKYLLFTGNQYGFSFAFDFNFFAIKQDYSAPMSRALDVAQKGITVRNFSKPI
jgi:hypothetical protein